MKTYTRTTFACMTVFWASTFLMRAQFGIAQSELPPITPYQQIAKSKEGDSSRGRLVFENRQTAGCTKCHTIDGSRTGVGPDLASIGFKFDRDRLVESILEPSKSIADGFSATTVITDSGEVFNGVLQRVTNDYVELKDAESKIVRVIVKEIVEQRQGTVSLMPANLHASITPDEFVDLIAYLESLRESPKQKVASNGFMEDVPVAKKGIVFRPFFSGGVRFDHPVAMLPIPSKSEAFVVAEQGGRCWLVENSSSTKRPLLDIAAQVRVGGATGLLGIAIHPKYPTDPRVYLKYQISENGRIVTIVEERTWEFSGDDEMAWVQPREILRITGSTQDHNGGSIAFGPDHFLYVGMGDSGPQRDPEGHGQDLKTFLGKILRVDVDHRRDGQAYAIPADNPFVDTPDAKKEIWALGFREPWRISFDSKTEELWVGDVGQDRFEEISIVKKGENHGWNVFEGFSEFSNQFRRSDAKMVNPIVSYPRQLGVSVTGGFVYRGKLAPQLEGWYLFGDFESRRLWGVLQRNRQMVQCLELGRAPNRIVSFGELADGELVLLGFDDGLIYRMDLQAVDLKPLQRKCLLDTAERTAGLWRFTLSKPSDTWKEVDFDDQKWSLGPSGFGTAGTPGSAVRTDWSTGDIWLRRDFTLNDQLDVSSTLSLRLHHDEDIEVYINGIRVFRADRWTTGYVDIPLNEPLRKALRFGKNCIAVHCHQNGGGQYVDVGIIEVREE